MINKNYAFAATIVLFFGFKCCAMDREGLEEFKKQFRSLYERLDNIMSGKNKIMLKEIYNEHVESTKKAQITVSKWEKVEEDNEKLRKEAKKFIESLNK